MFTTKSPASFHQDNWVSWQNARWVCLSWRECQYRSAHLVAHGRSFSKQKILKKVYLKHRSPEPTLSVLIRVRVVEEEGVSVLIRVSPYLEVPGVEAAGLLLDALLGGGRLHHEPLGEAHGSAGHPARLALAAVYRLAWVSVAAATTAPALCLCSRGVFRLAFKPKTAVTILI